MKTITLFALDAAYGGVGGDRCVGVELHVGKGIDGVRRTVVFDLARGFRLGAPKDGIKSVRDLKVEGAG